MPFVSQDQRIQRKLLEEAAQGPFYSVCYDKDTKQKSIDVVTLVEPAESTAQALSASFGVPSRHRRTDRLERRSWRWHLACRFAQEVSTEAFEKRLIQNNILLPRDVDNDLEQVSLKLQAADPFHPPQQAPNEGTHVTFVFEAELSPI